jgi:cytochrome d ubiquinol oxidase subunit I
MQLEVEILARLQFAFTIAFHYLFPPLSIGLGLLLVAMEAIYLRTNNAIYHRMARFWTKIFGLIFAVGVASGIVMEFEFGTNWATYSRYVGDVFGSALAAEGIFAFFLESGFLAILLFGWEKVGRGMHFFATLMVCLGAHFSAIWIIVANSWQQTPAGYHIVGEGLKARAEITDFWAMVFNPSTVDRLTHTLLGAWQAGAFLVISVSAWYLIKGIHSEVARRSMKIALTVAAVASVLQLVTGHQSAMGVARNQPVKLAAMEAHFDSSARADMYLFGLPSADGRQVAFGAKIPFPGMLGWFIHGDPEKRVPGLDSVAPDDRPPVPATFLFFHVMVAVGMAMIGLSLVGLWAWWRGTLFSTRWLLWLMVLSVLGPQVANQAGWFAAEVGRQPWIVYGLLRTSDGLSKAVNAGQVLSSLLLFGFIYALLFALFLYLLNEKIQHGPEEPEAASVPEENRGHRA